VSKPFLVRVLPFLLATLSSVAFAQEEAPKPSIPELFQKGKTAFKLGNYKASLEAFDKLDELSLAANELDRSKLEPVLAFYRGANLAALGQTEPARAQFEKYLALAPAAHLDPGAFPKAVIDQFNAARERSRPGTGASRAGVTEYGGMIADYARFRPEGAVQSTDRQWAEGAIRFLMTKAEREKWERLGDDVARAEFIADFWRSRDPSPLTPENEFRDEIERRIRYADAHFAAEEKRGSATDRGLVFVLLGAPSYVGQKPFKSEDDPVQAARAAPDKEIRFNPDGSKTITLHPRTGLTAETLQGTREIWYYRRDRLPKVVKFTEVDFEFITRKGLGTAVLQRDHEILVTLDLVARSTLPSRD
jgi:GWxTD domain-containing protein